MTEQSKGLFSVQEAATIWGISRQAVYKKLDNLDKEGHTGLHAGKRYITREGIDAYKDNVNQVDNKATNKADNLKKDNDNLKAQVDRLQEINEGQQTIIGNLKAQVDTLSDALQATQIQSSTLQATTEAQQAHIDSLKTALDREQSLHMASLQQRLPAGKSKGFFSWLRGDKSE